MSLPIIALTAGDCTGIGPEQTARILHDRRMAGTARLVVVGDARVLDLGMRRAGVSFGYRRYVSPASVDWSDEAIPRVDLDNTDPALYAPGVASAESGRVTGETLSRAIDFARDGEVDAITFAPLNKRAMYDGGWKFPDEQDVRPSAWPSRLFQRDERAG
jgi:4-hydroxy-L-threonine phosphate dehydrogenase PdxA